MANAKMPEYQQRVVEEKAELDTRLMALKAFIIDTELFPKLGYAEKRRLTVQFHAMTLYSGILEDRIENF